MTPPRTCPRCDAPEPARAADAPSGGVWQVFVCGRCFYTWRTTEPSSVSDPARFPPVFRVTHAAIDTARILPPITPPDRDADAERP